MLYGEQVDELLARLKLKKDDVENREIAKRKLNKSYREVGNITNVDWEALKRYGEIVTIPNYTTGTVAVVNGSRTVTGSGTTWTQAMEGRFFKALGSGQWYRVLKYVSATELTLLSPVQEDSAAGLTYSIWKRFYYFPSDVRRVLRFGSWIMDGELTEKSMAAIGDLNPDISLTGQPMQFTMFGVDPYGNEYTTGQISLTQDSNIATGSGTSWLGNVDAGDKLVISGQVYRVNRVESDTRIVMVQHSTKTIGDGGTTYSARKDKNIGFQLWYNANDTYLLPFYYIKRVYDMLNEDLDEMELPDDFDGAVLDGAEADRLSDLDDAKWLNKQALYSARINDLKATRFVSTPRTRQFRPKITNRGKYI